MKRAQQTPHGQTPDWQTPDWQTPDWQTPHWQMPRWPWPVPARWWGAALVLVACGQPISASAQGTWLQTACLQSAGATGPVGACRATPAWGQTGLDHVQSLAATAGPGNLGLSLVKPETLPAANAARAQLAAVMLGYLDGGLPASTYRWFGPVAPAAAAGAGKFTSKPALANLAANPANPGPAAAGLPVPGAAAASSPGSGAPGSAAAAALQMAWQTGAQGDEPQTRSAGWWLASPHLGLVAPLEVDSGADRYRSLRFLAAQCPQLEGKVAPNAWTRCTTYNVPEPGSAALAVAALLLLAAVQRLRPQKQLSQRQPLQPPWQAPS